jgi:cytidyltransferase-like protein
MSIIVNDNKIEKLPKKNIVLVGGCFDVLHPAHYEFLRLSKKQGNTLVVFLESDENITRLKGTGRPVNNQITRANNLSKIKDIDYIILLKTPSSSQYYYNLVKLLQPAIIAVTKNDPLLKIKEEQASMVGGHVIEVMERNTKHSSTSLIKNKR